MSILVVLADATAAAATEQAPQELPPAVVMGLLAWTIGSIAVAWWFHVFSPDALRGGEPRLERDDSLANFAMILLAGLCAWILIPGVYGAATRRPNPAATTQPSTTLTTTQPTTAPFAHDPAELITLSAVASSTALLVLVAGNLMFRRDGLRRLGLSPKRLARAIPIGALGIIVIMPFIFWVGALTMQLWKVLRLEHDTKHEMLRILESTDDRGLARLLVFTAAVIAPLYEEVLFRGHLQTLLSHLFGRLQPERDVVMEPYAAPNAAVMRPRSPSPAVKWLAILCTSLAFAAVHPWWTTPPILFLSVCLGYAYERWNNLWVPIVMHALFNAMSMTISQYVPQ
jgi:membrane protease YdiL (CAAX protease family)